MSKLPFVMILPTALLAALFGLRTASGQDFPDREHVESPETRLSYYRAPQQIPGSSYVPQNPFFPQSGMLTPEEIQEIDNTLISNILEINDPSQRALALVRSAAYKTAFREFEVARRALDLAAEAAFEVKTPLERDLRLRAIHEALIDLAEEDISDAIPQRADVPIERIVELSDADRLSELQDALNAFQRSTELAAKIERQSYRAEAIAFSVESQALGGARIGQLVYRQPELLRGREEFLPTLEELADEFMVLAAKDANKIDLPIWRDLALSTIVRACANANQFERGFEIASSIPGLELRADAMLQVAEAEARRGSDSRSTRAYSEAARAIGSIPIDDLRSTLTDVLVESLISSGRFKDARACIVFYPDDLDKLEALGAVAESMGSRGLSKEAQDWISTEASSEFRGTLYRRVNDGVLESLNTLRRNPTDFPSLDDFPFDPLGGDDLTP